MSATGHVQSIESLHPMPKECAPLANLFTSCQRPRNSPDAINGSSNPLASELRFHMTTIALRPIGKVASRLTDLADAPRQADEGAPAACLVIDADFAVALEGLKAGDEVIVITWLDRAQRDILRNYPRGDPSRPLAGVSTRSPHRPIRSGCTRSPSPPSTARACSSGASKPSMVRRSSTSRAC